MRGGNKIATIGVPIWREQFETLTEFEAWLEQQYIALRQSAAKIAKKLGCSYQTVLNWLAWLGIKTRDRSEAVVGNLHPNWKGGRRKDRGYVLVFCPAHPFCNGRKYVYQHRLVMEKHLGRYLLPAEVIHHIDGDPSNNKIKNLRLFASNSQHTFFHHNAKT